MLLLCACGGKTQAPAGPPKEYQLRGEIVRLDAEKQTATIKHEEIKGWMEAMTMEFPVKPPSEVAKLKAGSKITATVYVQDLDYWVGNVQPAAETRP